jgi:molybdate transport system substrate-binding protein
MLNRMLSSFAVVFAGASALVPMSAHADVTVLMSGGFSLAYKEALPQFEHETGIKVVTLSGASQGSGPKTIKAQLERGTHADMVILSGEGLADLKAEGLIVSGSEVGLATSPLGAAVRAGAPKPDVSTVPAFKDTLLKARLISMPGSTSGKFIKDKVLPQLGIADRAHVKLVARGIESTKMLAAGESDMALGPVSELVHQPGVDLVGPLPDEVQLVQTFTAAIVKGTKHENEAKQLIAFLASNKAAAAVHKAGMAQVLPPVPPEVVKEIAPTGKLRAAINFGNPVLAQKDAVTGEPRGVSAELSRDLARRLGVPIEFVRFESAGNVADAAKAGLWDIAFLAIDPKRANEIDFTAPYVVIAHQLRLP